MNARCAFWFVVLMFAAILLLACDVSDLTSLIPGDLSGTGAVPTASSSAGNQSSQGSDYLKCDPNKLPVPIPPNARNCQHVDVITNFQMNQPPKEVIAVYGELLAKEGWKRKDDGKLPGIGTWVKGTKQLNIIAIVEKGLTSVQVQEVAAK